MITSSGIVAPLGGACDLGAGRINMLVLRQRLIIKG
jgi:hypothetical protein